MHLAEVAVDRSTGQVRVVRGASFQDVGKVLDAEMFRGQVEGAYAMGLGEALTEETLWAPERGSRIRTSSITAFPRSSRCPRSRSIAVEGFLGAGPFGAKGLGEPPIIPVPAAVANAVADACGARLTELPMTPERVARALKLL